MGTGQVWVREGQEVSGGPPWGLTQGHSYSKQTQRQTDPVRAASRRVAVVTGEGTIAARRERLVAPGAGGVRHQEM